MKPSPIRLSLVFVSTSLAVLVSAHAHAEAPLDANAIMAKVLESDPLGLSGAEVKAKMTVTEKGGRTRALAFEARSRKYAAPLSKSVIAFKAPADVAGMKFLQVQRKDADDDRFLFTPELRRTRRVAGTARGEPFMGTDFSYADLDGRDLRESRSKRLADTVVSKQPCYHLDVTPTGSSAVYGRIELWVRKDNFVPLRWALYDKKSSPVKTLLVKELTHKGSRWFVTRSRMTDTNSGRSTELAFDNVSPRDDIPLESFSVRALEKE